MTQRNMLIITGIIQSTLTLLCLLEQVRPIATGQRR